MSEIVYKTAPEIMQILAEENVKLSGMTISEAASAFGYTKTSSGLYMKTIIETTATAAAVATTAAMASSSVAATSTTSGCTVALATTSTGALQAVGVASAALPVASCMAAAAGGYMVGNIIYENNSEFLDQLMYPLYDFITGQDVTSTLYEDVPTTAMLFDAAGNTYIDGRIVDSTKALLDAKASELQTEDVINSAPATVVLPLQSVIVPVRPNEAFPITMYGTSPSIKMFLNSATKPVKLVFTKNSTDYMTIYAFSEALFTATITNNITSENRVISETYNGRTIYTLRASIPSSYGSSTPAPNVPRSANQIYKYNGTWFTYPTNQIGYAVLYGIASQLGGLPAAIGTYIPGTSPEPLTFPEEVPAWKPVVVPKTPPTETPEPEKTPDENPDPKRLTPFITPFQPQPSKVPVKKPAEETKPKPFAIPVPNLNPGTSPQPYPLPEPALDPSTTFNPPVITPTVPQVPVKPSPAENIGTGGTPTTPILPPIFSENATGLLHVYNPTPAQIDEFGAWLWTTFSGTMMETLSKIFNNPMDAVIGLHEIYCTPTTGNNATIRAGFLDSGVASRLVSNRYVSISCGAIGVPEFWNNYLDYTPYTKAYCYLPFIGIVELNADDIIGHGVEITYKVDTYNGSCIALITTSRQGSAEVVTYQFSGNCSVAVPITSGVMSAAQSALIGLATGALTATGVGAVAGATVAASGIAKGAVAKNSVQHSGSFGSSYGAMGIKIPYLIIKRPKQVEVPGYNDTYGFPAHKRVTISSCQGFLKAIEVEVISPTATEEEKKLIEEMIKSGIYVN